jgi:hypothetical protein
VYGRTYDDKVLSFEPSGALLQAAITMRDRETDSWWSIMKEGAIGGELEGVSLDLIPAGEKVQWTDWKKRYPSTKVLSVDGEEHDPDDHYKDYFASEEGFRGATAEDKRLKDKEAIFAFTVGDTAYAVTHDTVEGGARFRLGDKEIYLFRKKGAPLYSSTEAYIEASDKEAGTGGEDREKMAGFDTFWYIWSRNHDHVIILK